MPPLPTPPPGNERFVEGQPDFDAPLPPTPPEDQAPDFEAPLPPTPPEEQAPDFDAPLPPTPDPPPQPPRHAIATGRTTTFSTHVGPGELVVLSTDKQFAPSVEPLDISYRVKDLAGKRVVLQIVGETVPVLHEQVLTEAETQDGTHALQWDGKITQGEQAGSWATPLSGPFLVRMSAGGLKAERPFNILYHSLDLRWGTHTPDGTTPPPSDKVAYAQARLNALGYHAGPVTGAMNDTTKRAIERFQRGTYAPKATAAATTAPTKPLPTKPLPTRPATSSPSPARPQTKPSDPYQTLPLAPTSSGPPKKALPTGPPRVGGLLVINGLLDSETVEALQVAAPRSIWEDGKDPLKADCRVYVYDNYFNDTHANLVTTTTPEFTSHDRKQFVEDKIDRPFIPLEVQVKLTRKNGQGVFAPEATGSALVAWEVDDAEEDATVVTSTPLSRTYVERARRYGTADTLSGASRIDDDGDNALDSLQGFRAPASSENIKAWFPDDADSRLAPYQVVRYGTEERHGTTFHRAIVAAHDHDTDHPTKRGCAGIYLRMSTKGGDDAKVRAALTFDGLPNKDKLDEAHQKQSPDWAAETGRWTTWRRMRVSAYCQQRTPTRPSGSPNWNQITRWWAEAFIEVENGGKPLQIIDYASVVTEEAYRAALLSLPPTHRPFGLSADTLTYRPEGVYGGPPLTQHEAESPDDYLTRANAAIVAWCEHPLNAIIKLIHDHTRQSSPEGLIIYDHSLYHESLEAKVWWPTPKPPASSQAPASPTPPASDPYQPLPIASKPDSKPPTKPLPTPPPDDPYQPLPIAAATPSQPGRWEPIGNPYYKTYWPSNRGYVRANGAVTMDVHNQADVNCYVIHECGHAKFLYHHYTDGGIACDTPLHHDMAQPRCAMSYPIDPDSVYQYTYSFCGKCLLRLRGWDVEALPRQYRQSAPAGPPKKPLPKSPPSDPYQTIPLAPNPDASASSPTQTAPAHAQPSDPYQTIPLAPADPSPPSTPQPSDPYQTIPLSPADASASSSPPKKPLPPNPNPKT
ncbi:MAG: peptidoglycan-binding domain-containing protein [Bacteroidota bacterium]